MYGEAIRDTLWNGGVVYDDRPLTRREWIKVKVLRRPDPRVTDWPIRVGLETTQITYTADGTFKID
jgi:hypothetical protein